MTVLLLDLVQDILSDANGDEVSSISDTTESMQCARMVASVYEDIVIEHDIQAVKRLFRLDGDSSTSTPTHMRIPEAYHSVEWIKYDKRTEVSDPPNFQDVCYKYPKEFIDTCNNRQVGDDNVAVATDPSGVDIHILTDKAPEWFTLFDDRHIVFDSYNSTVESTLHQAKTQAYGQMSTRLVLADATEINLPQELIPLLKNEARSMYLDIHAGGTTAKAEQAASRTRIRMQRLRHTMRNNREQFKHTGPNYGRRPR
jgi:hypothetical protein